MPSTTELPVVAEQEAACTTCITSAPAPPACDHSTPCFPIYPETQHTPAPGGPDQAELELLCGVER